MEKLLEKINKEKKLKEFPGKLPPEEINGGNVPSEEGELGNHINNNTIDTNNNQPFRIKKQFNKIKKKRSLVLNAQNVKIIQKLINLYLINLILWHI